MGRCRPTRSVRRLGLADQAVADLAAAAGATSRAKRAATSPDELAATLMGFDKDNDGKLTRAELPERLQGLFDRADADKDNALTADELKKSATSMANPSSDGRGDGREGEGRRGGGRGPGGPMGRDRLVATLDADRDGAISAGEIAGAATCASRARRQRGWPADAGGSPAVGAWTGRPAPPFLTPGQFTDYVR